MVNTHSRIHSKTSIAPLQVRYLSEVLISDTFVWKTK